MDKSLIIFKNKFKQFIKYLKKYNVYRMLFYLDIYYFICPNIQG